MPQESKIKLLIADDHEVLRAGLKSLLADTGIKVVAEVATGQAAVNTPWNTTWTSCSWTSACPMATA